LDFFFQVACEYGVILPILHLHHRIGSANQDVPQTQEPVKTKTLQEDDDEEIEEIEFEAEYLDNFELYKRMNPINTGQFSNLIS
jgi:hypothetical protein